LPAYRRIIFDEAHNLEDTAIKHLGIDISLNGILKQLNNLYNIVNSKEKGILQFVKNSILFKSKISKKERILNLFGEKLFPELIYLKNETELSFEIIKNYFAGIQPMSAFERRRAAQFAGFKIRLTLEITETSVYFENCEAQLIELSKLFAALSKNIEYIIKRYSEAAELEPCSDDEQIKNDLNVSKSRIDAIFIALTNFNKPPDRENTVRWVECDNLTKREIKLFAVPIDISKLFFESVALPHKTLLFTSATLAINKKFDFLKKSFGIDKLPADSIAEIILDTPFDYKNQSLLVIPSDLPLPDEHEFTAVTTQFLKRLFAVCESNAFVLFTSYSQLRKSANELRDELEMMGFTLFIQGERPRGKLLDSFKKSRKSLLFATDSFWEGVDVKGDALESVILFKLPFKTPDDPIIEAKNELLLKQGKNPFYEYQLPKAVIKLKQGIGRLIRTKNDIGIVVILDKRIKSKNYGSTFFNSLPPLPIIYNTADNCLVNINNFFMGNM